jgi:hypothetical protein
LRGDEHTTVLAGGFMTIDFEMLDFLVGRPMEFPV